MRIRIGKTAVPAARLGLCLLLLLVFSTPACSKESFGYKNVVEKARLIAQKPFQQPGGLPGFLSKIDYDKWRDIRFKPKDTLWLKDKLPFHVGFFFPGWVFNRVEKINVIKWGKVKPISFSPKLFNYGMNEFDYKALKSLGFAGFRLDYPINTLHYYDEFAVFLGASYFRAIGRNEHYGLSARSVAIDTALPTGEQFPYFREFWLVRPAWKATSITVFALLDGRSLTGAYRFVIKPGEPTSMYVTATLFLRKKVKKLGIAPLTSMFFYGANTNIRPVDNFRPQVHDSDGLQIATVTGEWIWRPLINPGRLLVTTFKLYNPRGFGLFQRDRDFGDYQDLKNEYQIRPCAWIVPRGNWGEGRVELVEIPTNSEENDNIVAYWVPAATFKPGSPVHFSYQIKWGPPDIGEPPLARVIATRTSMGKEREVKTYLIDFEGGKLNALWVDPKLKAAISVDGGKIVEKHLEKNKFTGGWRLVITVHRTDTDRPLELRAFLRQKDRVLTETWSYVDPFTESGCR